MSITSVRSRPGFTSLDEFAWPGDFARIPDEEWTRQPVDQFGLNYDDVGSHGWYKNLEPTIAQVLADAGARRPARRLFQRHGDLDAAPARARSAIRSAYSTWTHRRNSCASRWRSFRDDERVAFRLLHWLKADKRLQSLDEVAGPDLLDRGADAITSTNAIHLYYDLDETLASWARVLRPGGLAFVCSGNMRNPNGQAGRMDHRRDRGQGQRHRRRHRARRAGVR